MKQFGFALSDAGEVLNLDIYSVIGESIWFDAVSAGSVLRALAGTEGKFSTINVNIHSDGGDIFEASDIYFQLAEHPAKKVVRIGGLAASAASFVAMVGDEIIMGPAAWMMIHHPWGGAQGSAEKLIGWGETLLKARDTYANIYASRSKQSKEKTLEMMAAETWLTADEAVKLGFADRVEHALSAPADAKLKARAQRAFAAASISDFTNVPEAVRALMNTARGELEEERRVAPAVSDPKPTPAPPPVASTGTTGANPEGTNTMKTISLALVAAFLGMTEAQAAVAEEKDIVDGLDKLKKKADAPPSVAVSVGGVALLGVATEAEAATKINDLQRVELRLLAGTGKGSLAEAMVVVDSWKTDAAERPKDALKIAALTEESRVAKRDGAIAKLSQSGHLPPARHEWAKQKFTTADALESFFEGMPVNFLNSGTTELTDASAAVTLTASERETCAKVGISEELYLEQKKLDMQRVNARVGG